jgi:hypothetical protein
MMISLGRSCDAVGRNVHVQVAYVQFARGGQDASIGDQAHENYSFHGQV